MDDEVIPTLSQPMPDFQREYLEKRGLEHLQTYPEFTQLEQKLLSMGGKMVVPRREPDQDQIISWGRIWNSENIRVVSGVPSNAHGNVAELWRSNPKRARTSFEAQQVEAT